MRPKGYLVVTLLLGFFSIEPLLSFDINPSRPLYDITETAITLWVGLALTVLFWFRFNFARLLILFGYFIIVMTVYTDLVQHNQPPQTPLERVIFISMGAFGLFLFYWLNTKKVRTYFKERKLHVPPPTSFEHKPPIPEP